jgi:hypothetical protein
MTNDSDSSLKSMAHELVNELTGRLFTPHGISSMSPSIYDTAWVSMIAKPGKFDGKSQWLFPEAFNYLLENQCSDGGWGKNATQTDGLLNTMAAQLSMMKHRDACIAEPGTITLIADLDARIKKACHFLQSLFSAWDVESSVHVGFEILIPALLSILEADGPKLNFPGRKSLMALNKKKLSKFDPEILYTNQRTTLIHSLEAFVGLIDFDRVRHHIVSGSMMASPSSTAAYLMNSSTWDEEAEVYIRSAISFSSGNGSGGVPSAFPTTIFEISWIVSTILENGVDTEIIRGEVSASIAEFLNAELVVGGGVLGFGEYANLPL